MARLVLLNGPPGVGKSTLARRYADEHPLTLALEIDAVRAMLGDWLEHTQESGLAARRLALAMAETHLRSRHDGSSRSSSRAGSSSRSCRRSPQASTPGSSSSRCSTSGRPRSGAP